MNKISKKNYLAVEGLLHLASLHYKGLEDIKSALMELTKEDDEWGHCSDVVFGNGDFTAKYLLKKLNITVSK